MVINMLRKKRGWIKIVEAFVAVLLIAGVLIFVYSKGYLGGPDISERVYEIEKNILRSVELNEQLRAEIIDTAKIVPLDVTENNFPKVYEKIQTDLVNYDYLSCVSRVCALNELCPLNPIPSEAKEKDIYSQQVAITATSQQYNPRQLKIFCWTK